MHPMLNTAVRAARRAGEIINRSLERHQDLPVESKGHHDFVTEVDRAAEEAITETLHKAYPDHTIMGEEGGTSHDSGSGRRWIIDPLDGTTNFIRGIPQFAVSIALEVDGRLDQGVIYDPAANDLFTASRGSGAYLNDRRIRVTDPKGIDGALLGTGFPFRHGDLIEPYLDSFRAFMPHVSGIRRPGAAALDLAWVACGRYDGFWEFRLNPWDMAAGILLVREAGGVVTDFDGGEDPFVTGNVLAAGPRLQRAMLQRLRETVPSDLRKPFT
jgi:myo-inositol-1(or 4)-monophosphatase